VPAELAFNETEDAFVLFRHFAECCSIFIPPLAYVKHPDTLVAIEENPVDFSVCICVKNMPGKQEGNMENQDVILGCQFE
jgi:hypothetical protein